MIAPDVNLLVYAIDGDSPFHAKAKVWLEDILSGTEPVGFAWNVLIGFVRLTTRKGVVLRPFSVNEAFETLALWLERAHVRIIEPGPRHYDLLRSLLLSAGTAGNLTSDAHLAAVAMAHNAKVHSTDADFGKFPGLRWRNPLH